MKLQVDEVSLQLRFMNFLQMRQVMLSHDSCKFCGFIWNMIRKLLLLYVFKTSNTPVLKPIKHFYSTPDT